MAYETELNCLSIGLFYIYYSLSFQLLARNRILCSSRSLFAEWLAWDGFAFLFFVSNEKIIVKNDAIQFSLCVCVYATAKLVTYSAVN